MFCCFLNPRKVSKFFNISIIKNILKAPFFITNSNLIIAFSTLNNFIKQKDACFLTSFFRTYMKIRQNQKGLLWIRNLYFNFCPFTSLLNTKGWEICAFFIEKIDISVQILILKYLDSMDM